ncbi:MAG: DUF92 domain-containing protein [Balneolaceae bacterium]
MDKALNYIFGFLLILTFTWKGMAEDHIRIFLAISLAGLLLLPALILNWITADGYRAALVFGTVILGLGGWVMAALVLLFFVSGSILTRERERFLRATGEEMSEKVERRSGSQVWANGFWIGLFVVVWFLTGDSLFLIAAAASVATATADTWATEIGNRKHVPTRLISDLSRVEPGTEGGVSLNGLVGAFSGALFIGISWLLLHHSLNMQTGAVIVVSGFAGCLLDSLLGALFQYRKIGRSIRFLRTISVPERANNWVNWAATGAGGFIALLMMQWI